MAWTSDGYALAVGYEHGWAVWTVGGRLNGWGMALAERDGEGGNGSTDGFNEGVVDLVSIRVGCGPGKCGRHSTDKTSFGHRGTWNSSS